MITLLETGAHHELPFPAIVFGLIAFGLLLLAVLAVESFGRMRPHSGTDVGDSTEVVRAH